MHLKYHPKKDRKETEFDEDGRPIVKLEFDELGRPIRRKPHFWEF